MNINTDSKYLYLHDRWNNIIDISVFKFLATLVNLNYLSIYLSYFLFYLTYKRSDYIEQKTNLFKR